MSEPAKSSFEAKDPYDSNSPPSNSDVCQWSSIQVQQWLCQEGFSNLTRFFLNINGEALQRFDAAALQQKGLPLAAVDPLLITLAKLFHRDGKLLEPSHPSASGTFSLVSVYSSLISNMSLVLSSKRSSAICPCHPRCSSTPINDFCVRR